MRSLSGLRIGDATQAYILGDGENQHNIGDDGDGPLAWRGESDYAGEDQGRAATYPEQICNDSKDAQRTGSGAARALAHQDGLEAVSDKAQTQHKYDCRG